MKKILLTCFFIFPALFIWAQHNYQKSVIQSSAYWLDVDYAGDRIVGHRLDVHLPKTGKAPYPVIIAVYGSAFFSNSSKGNTFQEGLGQKMLENGYAVVSVNHRSSSDGIYPIQIQDIKTAIRFIRKNASSFNLKADKIGITGWSSGGHLSALAGTTSGKTNGKLGSAVVDLTGTTPKYKEHSDAVQAVVDWFGPTDFLIMDSCGSTMNHDEEKSPESKLIGSKIQENRDKTTLANPAFYVTADTPPFLIFHGDKDPLVPLCQSEKLHARLVDKGVKSTLVVVPDGKHGPGVMIEKYYDQMILFFNQYIK